MSVNTGETPVERINRIMSDYVAPGLGVLMSEDDIQWLAEQAQKLHSSPDVGAELANIADQLTELAESMRHQANAVKKPALRTAGLLEGITVIRERAALLRARTDQDQSLS